VEPPEAAQRFLARQRTGRRSRNDNWRCRSDRRRWLQPSGFRGSFLGNFICFSFCSCSHFGVSELFEMLAHLLGHWQIDGAGVRFLFLDSHLRQIIYDRFGLYFKIAGQFVDPNLINVRHQ
jgi:hypothetical protein